MEQLLAEELTNRQLALANYRRLAQMEMLMTELSQAVSDLQNSVAGVAERLLPQIQTLQTALADSEAAQTALQDSLDRAAAEDVAEDAEFQAQIEAQKADLQAAQEAANQAASDIETEVGKLNSMGAGETPTEEPPVEEPPAEPVEPA